MIARLRVDDGLRHVAWCTNEACGRYTTVCGYEYGHRPKLSDLRHDDLQVVLVGPPTCLFCVAR